MTRTDNNQEMDAEERINELEQKVENLQDQLPDGVNRREALKAGGALGLGALLGGGGAATAIDSAKASHGGGSIGTESDPVGTIYAHQFGSSTEPIQSLHADSQTSMTVGTLNADEQLTDIIGQSGVSGKIHYASNNHADLPDFQQAINNASFADTVVLLPGGHDISSTVTVDTPLVLVMYGTLVKQADVLGMQITAACTISSGAPPNSNDTLTSAVSDTTNGIEINKKCSTHGSIAVNDVGNVGIRYQSSTAGGGGNVNNSEVSLIARNCGDQGIVIAGTDANGMIVNIPVVINNGRDGVFVGCEGSIVNVGTAEQNTENGVSVSAAYSKVSAGWVEGNGTGINVQNSTNDAAVLYGRMYNNTTTLSDNSPSSTSVKQFGGL